MKVSNIKIKDFHQFKDIDIDLTYPKGHQLAGQPLEKICFIGQSGTGKTTLLEFIPKFLFAYNTNITTKLNESDYHGKIFVSLVFGRSNEYSGNISFEESSSEEGTWMWNDMKKNSEVIEWNDAIKFFDKEWTNKIATKLIYFPSNLDYEVDVNESDKLDDKAIIDFSKNKVSLVWNLLLDDIQKYQEQELQIRQDISKTVEQSSNDLNTIKKALKKLEDWKKKEFNPIQDVADNCLNKLLNYFKLRVKTELDIKKREDIGFIKIEDFQSNEIPHGLWSTGTKQVVLSSLPLYLLKPKNTIILFDEPERSLYPDLQRLIVDFYSSMANNCQFFYSTHSSIIASSFEPWEIVELKFDENNNIYRELYFEGDNHVKNYKWNPKLMRWDDILQRIFDLESDGSPERKKRLDKLAEFNVRYKKLKQAGKDQTNEAKDTLKEINKLSYELSKWD